MLNINIFENIVLKCFCFQKNKEDDELDRKIYNVSREHKISILPITPNFDIDNLYPLTDHVELWNIFIIGNDKTYILANINDPHIVIPQKEQLPNRQGQNLLPEELFIVFDGVWTKTLQGKQLQFYMVWNSKLYFINTYPFFNGKAKVIGAILFMRAFETMPDARFTTLDGYLVPIRNSIDMPRSIDVKQLSPTDQSSKSRTPDQGTRDSTAFRNILGALMSNTPRRPDNLKSHAPQTDDFS